MAMDFKPCSLSFCDIFETSRQTDSTVINVYVLGLYCCDETTRPQQLLERRTFIWVVYSFRSLVHYLYGETWQHAGSHGAGEGAESGDRATS